MLYLPAGSNLICTSIHRALSRLFQTHCVDGRDPYIDQLYVQVDNCIGENKNHIVLAYLGSLVGRGVVGRAEVNFMVVGHTHTLIDQVFSRQVFGPLLQWALLLRARLVDVRTSFFWIRGRPLFSRLIASCMLTVNLKVACFGKRGYIGHEEEVD